MTRELIEDFDKIVKPFVQKRLLEENFEGMGEQDKAEFGRDFDEILSLAIKGLESSTWIPVTERLPEEDMNVLVTIVKGRHTVMYAKYDRQLQKFCVGNYIRSKYVTAWMPLTEPYKAESEGEE